VIAVQAPPAPPVSPVPAPPVLALSPAPYQPVPTATAPEIDATSALSAMTLLFGGVLLLRGRKVG